MILLVSVAVVVSKAICAGAAIRTLDYPWRVSVIGAIGLAQIGEFSFLLMSEGSREAWWASEIYQYLLATAILTMVATPFLMQAAPWAGRVLRPAPDPGARAGGPGGGVRRCRTGREPRDHLRVRDERKEPRPRAALDARSLRRRRSERRDGAGRPGGGGADLLRGREQPGDPRPRRGGPRPDAGAGHLRPDGDPPRGGGGPAGQPAAGHPRADAVRGGRGRPDRPGGERGHPRGVRDVGGDLLPGPARVPRPRPRHLAAG